MHIKDQSHCPCCDFKLEIEDMAQHLFNSGAYPTIMHAQMDAEGFFGWSLENPKGSKLLKLMQEDGVHSLKTVYYQCPNCFTVWRNNGEEMSDHEASYLLSTINT